MASPDAGSAKTFAETRGRWPVASPPAGWTISALPRHDGVRVNLQTPAGVALTGASFFPLDQGLMDAAAAQTVHRDGRHHTLDQRAADVPLAPWDRRSGVAVARMTNEGSAPPAAFVVDLPLTNGGGTSPDREVPGSRPPMSIAASATSPPAAALPLPLLVAALLVFAALGLGMALPVALVMLCPALRRWLPRPGPWVVRRKEFLALPLYWTVVWLAWVLTEPIGTSGGITVGGGLLAIGLLAWALRLAAGWVRRCAIALALLSALGAALWPALPTSGSAPRALAATGADWQPWSAEAFASARATQQPVFVDFTAA